MGGRPVVGDGTRRAERGFRLLGGATHQGVGRRHQSGRDPGLDACDSSPLGNQLSGPLRLLSLLQNSSLA